jgi:hypothetical protein
VRPRPPRGPAALAAAAAQQEQQQQQRRRRPLPRGRQPRATSRPNLMGSVQPFAPDCGLPKRPPCAGEGWRGAVQGRQGGVAGSSPGVEPAGRLSK